MCYPQFSNFSPKPTPPAGMLQPEHLFPGQPNRAPPAPGKMALQATGLTATGGREATIGIGGRGRGVGALMQGQKSPVKAMQPGQILLIKIFGERRCRGVSSNRDLLRGARRSRNEKWGWNPGQAYMTRGRESQSRGFGFRLPRVGRCSRRGRAGDQRRGAGGAVHEQAHYKSSMGVRAKGQGKGRSSYQMRLTQSGVYLYIRALRPFGGPGIDGRGG